MRTVEFQALAAAVFAAGAVFAGAPALAATSLEAYRIADRAEEIALARSAAPASISDKAEILVLGDAGYEVAAPGTNGFACLVVRSWGADFDDAEFWNPKIRSPICYNATSVRSVLPAYLTRSQWVLSGTSVAEMRSRTTAAWTSGATPPPEAGAMCYMMSKRGYVGDKAAGPWRPHLMFFVPQAQPEAWGANLPGVPVMGGGGKEPVSVFFIPVGKWSDGTSDQGDHAEHG